MTTIGTRTNLRPVQGTLSEQAYRAIRQAILDGELTPGQTLVEDELAARLGVSKTPVRQALSHLEHEGLVVRVPYKATYVAELSAHDAEEIIELRAVLEAVAVRSVTTTIDEATLGEAEVLLDRYDEALASGDLPTAYRLGEEFHDLVLGRATNRRAVSMLDSLRLQIRRLRVIGGSHPDRAREAGTEHRSILSALRARDADAVEQAIRRHHRNFIDHVQSGRAPMMAGTVGPTRATRDEETA